MNPTITVRPSGDTGSFLTGPDSLAAKLDNAIGITPARVLVFGGAGALVGKLAGKHALIGAVIGAVGGYYVARKAIANGASNGNIPTVT